VRIHIDIDPAEINKMINVHHYCIGDAKAALKRTARTSAKLDTGEWLKLDGYKKKYPLKYGKQGGLKMQQVLDELYKHDQAARSSSSTDVGQHQMWAAQFSRPTSPDRLVESGGAGTMGYGFPGRDRRAIRQAPGTGVGDLGDGGFQMTLCELATACVHKLPVKIVC
jgi:acetolactate synthase I/II/III large subunit